VLAAKNSLTAADAKQVEEAFEQQIAGLVEPVVADEPVRTRSPQPWPQPTRLP
jgi:hypothetical protein